MIPECCKNVLGVSGDHGESFWYFLVSLGVVLGSCHDIGKIRRDPNVLEPCGSGRATAAKTDVSWHDSIHERRLFAMRDHWYQLKIEKHGQNGPLWGKCVQSAPKGKTTTRGEGECFAPCQKHTPHTPTHSWCVFGACRSDRFRVVGGGFRALDDEFLIFQNL